MFFILPYYLAEVAQQKHRIVQYYIIIRECVQEILSFSVVWFEVQLLNYNCLSQILLRKFQCDLEDWKPYIEP